MKGFMQFVRKRGVGTALTLFLGIASIAIGIALSNNWGNPWISGSVYLVGGGLICLAVFSFLVGPADEASGEVSGKQVDPNPSTKSQGNISKEDREVGVKVPPDTPVLIDKVPPDTSINVSTSEELDDEVKGGDKDETSES